MRWIIRILGALCVLVFLSIVAALLIPAERIAAGISERITAATGRAVAIDGQARPTLWPNPGVVVEGLRIANPTWAGTTPMIAAERVQISLGWGAVFRGDTQIKSVVFDGTRVMLVRAADGRMSWDMGEGWEFGLQEGVIRGGTLRYLDRAAGADWDLSDLDASLTAPVDGPVSLRADARLNTVPLVLEATMTDAAGLLSGAARPIGADLRWQGGSAGFAGDLALDGTMDGTLSLRAEDLGPLASLSGGQMPVLPLGLGRERVEITGQFRRSLDGSLHLRGGEMRLDETVLNVALDVTAGEARPMLRATVTGGTVALGGLMPHGAASEGWPREVMDVSSLFATDADMTIRLEQLELGRVPLGDVDLRATINRGRLVFDIAQITAYDGQLAGRFVINGRGGLSVGGDMILADADLGALLGDAFGYGRLDARGSASVDFLGVGDDLNTIMAGLEADGDVTLGQGSFSGLDLDALSQTPQPEGQGADPVTRFDRFSGDVSVREGQGRMTDLRLDAPWGVLEGSGTLDAAAMSLTAALAPPADSPRAPLAVSGPWSAPEVEVDADALAARTALQEEAARVEAEATQARAEAQAAADTEILERAAEFLGVEIDTSGTPEVLLQRLQQGGDPAALPRLRVESGEVE